jgi:hypothetical protein
VDDEKWVYNRQLVDMRVMQVRLKTLNVHQSIVCWA